MYRIYLCMVVLENMSCAVACMGSKVWREREPKQSSRPTGERRGKRCGKKKQL